MGILSVHNLMLNIDGNKILDDVNMNFEEGLIHAVIGPNGAGKSTLVSTIMGLSGFRDIQGDIILEGASIKNLDISERASRGLTLAWQEPARFEGLKVRDYLRASVREITQDNIELALSKVGLAAAAYMNRSVDKTLSGGERKKLELASVLAMRPKIAFLDEPDSGIDIESIEKIFDAVKFLNQNKSTVVLITHSLTVLEQAEYGFLMCNGRIVDRGEVAKIRRYFVEKCISCASEVLTGKDSR